MKKIVALFLFLLIATMVSAQAGPPYTYKFLKPKPSWGQAVSFGNLSPGFFQVMYQNNKTGIVRLATYGIVGASMDKLKNPKLMMVFSFEQKPMVGREYPEELFIARTDD